MRVNEIITNTILEVLEKGIIPWQKPWLNQAHQNFISRRPYSGINRLWLNYIANDRLYSSPYWLTFQQIEQLGKKLKKGSKSVLIVFSKSYSKAYAVIGDDTGDEVEKKETRSVLRYYRIFNTQDVEGLENAHEEDAQIIFDPIFSAERIVQGYKDKPQILSGGSYSAYNPKTDSIQLPAKYSFTSIPNYYSTLFHELIHSTGHKDRLKREGIVSNALFGSKVYSKEELIAEIGSCFLSGIAGIEPNYENSGAYIDSWIKVLRNDKNCIISASAQAEKASNYITQDRPVNG